ncbi:MAG TPA: hypothetical protein PKE20_07925, partial [Promineifilum sp.]|nr:hypothetical protein [Promineifilum sp.]
NKPQAGNAPRLPAGEPDVHRSDLYPGRMAQQLLAVGDPATFGTNMRGIVDQQHVTGDINAEGFLQLAQFFTHEFTVTK